MICVKEIIEKHLNGSTDEDRRALPVVVVILNQ